MAAAEEIGLDSALVAELDAILTLTENRKTAPKASFSGKL